MLDDEEPGLFLKGGLGCAAVVVVGLILKGLFATYLGLVLGSFFDLARFLTAGSWPVQKGYIQEWGAKYTGDGAYSSWAEFLYEVDGEVYRGWQLTLSQPEFSSEASARQALAAFPIGKKVHVSVNPFDPTDAVLDPATRDWKILALRLAGGCLVLALVGAVLVAMEVPYYAVALALCALIALGGLGRARTTDPTARHEGISTAQLWERYARVTEMRAAWSKLKEGDLVSSAPAIGEPDKVLNSAGGLQTWIFDLGSGMETSGKLMVIPSTRGWIVDRVYPPYATLP